MKKIEKIKKKAEKNSIIKFFYFYSQANEIQVIR